MFKKRWKEKWKKILGISALLVGALLPTVNCMAADTGTLRIEYFGRTETDEKIVLEGASFALYYVGDMQEGKWNLSQEFQNAGVSLEHSESSERKKQAEKLYAYAVEGKITGTVQKTDKAGIGQFANLKGGVYLVAQTEDLCMEEGIFRSSPFLISLPGKENESLTWNVVVEPKSEWVNNPQKEPLEPEIPNKDKESEKTDEVKTGDHTPIEMLLIMFFISMSMSMIGIVWTKKVYIKEAQNRGLNE